MKILLAATAIVLTATVAAATPGVAMDVVAGAVLGLAGIWAIRRKPATS